MSKNEGVVILMADDDDDDYLLTQKALKESKLLNTLCRVKDGEELIDYLKLRGDYANGQPCLRPGVILLDLNMPRKDGREALREIKSDPDLSDIPIVVFTTSKAEEDIYRSYKLGVNSFITKPVTFENLIQVMQTLGKYWFEIVELPGANDGTNKA
ncbi:MAG TPA: response regulator [Candidatus Saccharimonadales bacterium]|nr:response regulator [Candidatus Saccharimonadales bacterium]